MAQPRRVLLSTAVLFCGSVLLSTALLCGGCDGFLPQRRSLKSTAVHERATALHSKPLQVVTDIDDTIKSSGNVRLVDIPLGGIDGQYARGAFYPGVFDFIAELSSSRGPAEPVAVLTARAAEFKNPYRLELRDSDKVVKQFRACAKRRGMGGWGVAYDRVMYGSVHEWIFQDFKGWRKLQNFEILARNLGDLRSLSDPAPASPAREYVFLGDTGELDGQAGELILARYPGLCQTVLLHCVGTDARGDGVAVPQPYAVDAQGPAQVHFFRTYVGAAAIALELGLVDARAVQRVVEAALSDLEKAGIFPGNDPRNQLRDVQRDIDALR